MKSSSMVFLFSSGTQFFFDYGTSFTGHSFLYECRGNLTGLIIAGRSESRQKGGFPGDLTMDYVNSVDALLISQVHFSCVSCSYSWIVFNQMPLRWIVRGFSQLGLISLVQSARHVFVNFLEQTTL